MAKKVYIADLDAHIVSFTKKIDDATRQTLDASAKMTNAFNRVTAAMEKDMQKSSTSVRNFSKRDLGMLTTQLFATVGASGKLGSQLSNLASGLLMGGTIGAAFAGFSAILNSITSETNKWSDALKTAAGQLISFKSEFDKIKFEANEKNISALIKATEESIAGQESKIKSIWMKRITSEGDKIPIIDDLSIWIDQMLGGAMSLTEEEQDRLKADKMILENLEEQKLKYEAMKLIADRLKALNFEEAVDSEALRKAWEENLKNLMKFTKTLQPRGVNVDALMQAAAGPKGGAFPIAEMDPWFAKMLKAKTEDILIPEKTENRMGALVSLSNQMASNFHFAGHTFVGQLSQAIAMVDSISNIILTIASLLGSGGGGFGIGGLLSLIGLEKGGRVTNRFGSLSLTNIPSFASGGSYSTPAFSGPFGGGYPVMVHKNETLDVYNSGQSSRLEKIMMSVKDAIVTSNIHLSKRGRGGGGVTVINLDGKTIAKAVQKNINKMEKSNYRLAEL